MTSKLEQIAKRDDEDIVWLMSSIVGRRIMNRILTLSAFDQLSMTGNSHTFFNEGKRSVGQPFYQTILHHCPKNFIEMLEEAKRNANEIQELSGVNE